MLRRSMFLVLLTCAAVLLARLSLQYPLHWDASRAGSNSLPAEAGQALAALDSPLAVTAFVPELPLARRQVQGLFDRVARLHPASRLHFIDPAYHPEQMRALGIQRNGEVLLEANGRTEHLRKLTPATLTAALVRLARKGEDWVLVLDPGTQLDDTGPTGLSGFGRALEDLGYRVVGFNVEELAEIPRNTALLIVPPDVRSLPADMPGFLDRGGRVLWLNQSGHPAAFGSALGVGLLPGVIVDAAASRMGLPRPEHAVVSRFDSTWLAAPPTMPAIFPTARALNFAPASGWRMAGRLDTGSQSWNETGPIRGEIARDEDAETAGPLTVAIGLGRSAGDTVARVVVAGDIDFLSNQWLHRGGNLGTALALVNWLTDNTAPAPAANAAKPELAVAG